RHEGKQAGKTARGQDEAYVLLRPFLLGQINGYIGTETSQHRSIEKIDSVKAVQARTRWRRTSSIRQYGNCCHLAGCSAGWLDQDQRPTRLAIKLQIRARCRE